MIDALTAADFEMNAADFNELPDSEKKHFYHCERCGEMVDMRQLDDVLFHEDQVPRHVALRICSIRPVVFLGPSGGWDSG